MTLSPKGREQLVAVPSIGRASEVTPRRSAPEADATRDLYERYARQIYSYCLHQLGNREEAEDATQSTFLNAFRGFKRGVDPEFESAWLYKIAQNVCLTRQRSSSRRRKVEAPGDLDAMQDFVPAHQVDSDELIRLPEALDAMPEQQRRALLLREWQGLSYKEIGDELDLSQAAVETLLFRARRSLAAGLSDEPATKAACAGKRLGASDLGSVLSILKSLLFTGGAKVATAVATVAATSVVAATPVTRHAVEDAVAPRHDKAPVHQVSTKAAAATRAASVGAPLTLVPHSTAAFRSVWRSTVRSAPLTVAAAKARRQRLALRARTSTAGTAAGSSLVGHPPSTDEAAPAITSSAPTPPAETPVPAPPAEPAAPATVDAPTPQQPAATQTGASKGDTTPPQATAVVAPATPAKANDRVLASTADEKKNRDKKNADKGAKAAEQGKAPTVTTSTPAVTPPVITTTTTTPTVTLAADTTTTATTTPAPPTPTPVAAPDAAPQQAQNDVSSRPAEGHRGDGKNNGGDGNGKKK
jgi:RNA polymerase sigma-70 factor (ECF subfamily)